MGKNGGLGKYTLEEQTRLRGSLRWLELTGTLTAREERSRYSRERVLRAEGGTWQSMARAARGGGRDWDRRERPAMVRCPEKG